jgi:frizzled 4
VGTFLFIYCVPSGLLLITLFYEFANRENWLNVPHPSMEPTSVPKAPMAPFMVFYFTELLIGILASAWAVGPRIASLFRCRQPKPVYKAPVAQPKYIQSPYIMSTASYHTVCQQNSIPSIPIGRIPRHNRKYPPYAGRKTRTTYQSSSQTMSLTGNETVL